MEFTGERPLGNNELFSSRIRYKTILPYVMKKNVLDFGCGVGHGSYFLSRFCNKVIGYDKSSEAIEEATNNSPRRITLPLKFTNIMPDYTENIEIVNSCEVIEHLEKDELETKLNAFKNLCSTFVGTTPNGDVLYYQPKTIEERRGYHLWHYTYEQLYHLLSRFYRYVEIQGHAFDPKLNLFTGYTFFATNKIDWTNDWLNTFFI